MSWSPEGQKLALAWSDNTMLLWDVPKENSVFEVKLAHKINITPIIMQWTQQEDCCFISISGLAIISVSKDLKIKIIQIYNELTYQTSECEFVHRGMIQKYEYPHYPYNTRNNICFCYIEGQYPLIVGSGDELIHRYSIDGHIGNAFEGGVIAPVPGIMRLFWAFSSSNPPESPSQEDSSLANMLDTLEARCRSDGPPAGPRSIDPLPGSRSFLTVSAVA